MFNNLSNTSLADVSSEELELAMGAPAKPENTKPENTKTEPTKSSAEENKDKPTKQKSTPSSKSISQPIIGNLSDVDDEDLNSAFGNDDDDNDDENNDEDKGSKTDNDGAGGNDDKNDGEDGKPSEDDEPNDAEESDISVSDFLKARADLLIKKGVWVDFEGRENAEWDEATFEDMEMKQQDYKREVMREEILESFGPFGKQVAEYAANGGDPDKLIDMFKEEQRLDNLSTETEEGQKNVVFKYMTEVLGKSPERANKAIQTLIADKELADEANENKKLMQESMQKQIEAEQIRQKAKLEAAKEDQIKTLQTFSNNVVSYLSSATNIPEEEKKEVISALTKFDKKLKNGAPVNDFYFKFAEFKKNLPDYIDLVRFVLNPKKFTQNLVTQGNNKATERAFNLARTANSSKKSKSTTAAIGGPNTGKPTTTFKLY